MQIHNVEQKTPEWYALRLKHPFTASDAQAIGNNGKGLETLCWEKVAERHSSGDRDNFSNGHTERGTDLEPHGRSLYELETGNEVKEVGFITNEEVSKLCGASPDGLVGSEGLFEEKCFDDVKHFKLTLEPEIESKYVWQMQMQMLVTGRKWCDFVAFNPNFKKSLVIIRIERDEEKQKAIKEGLVKGEEIIKTIESKIK